MRADIFVHPNYLEFEPTRHTKRAGRRPYRRMQRELAHKYAGASARVLAFSPGITGPWEPTIGAALELEVATRWGQGSVPREGRDQIRDLVDRLGLTQARLHGLFLFRCLGEFAESLAEVDSKIAVDYGVIGLRRDDLTISQRISLAHTCRASDTEAVVERLKSINPYFEEEEMRFFTPETKVFVV